MKLPIDIFLIVETPNKWDRNLHSPAHCIAGCVASEIKAQTIVHDLTFEKNGSSTSEGGYDAREVVEYKKIPVQVDLADVDARKKSDFVIELIKSMPRTYQNETADRLAELFGGDFNGELNRSLAEGGYDMVIIERRAAYKQSMPPEETPVAASPEEAKI